MSKPWLSREPTTHNYRTTWGPAAEASADLLRSAGQCVLTGAGVGAVHLAVTGYGGAPDAGASLWLALGTSGLLLAGVNVFAVAGDTLGQVQAARDMAKLAAGASLEDDDYEDEPAPPASPHVVNVQEWLLDGVLPSGTPNVKQARRYSLPCTPRQLAGFARMVLDGRNISEASVKQYAGVGRKTWLKLRNELVGRGHLAWKHSGANTQGVEITRGGIALCKSVLHRPTGGDV